MLFVFTRFKEEDSFLLEKKKYIHINLDTSKFLPTVNLVYYLPFHIDDFTLHFPSGIGLTIDTVVFTEM